MTDRAVVHLPLIADLPNDHLTRVQPHSDGELHTLSGELARKRDKRRVQLKRRQAGPTGVILIGDGRPEQRQHPVAGELLDRALDAMYRLADDYEEAIQQPAPALRVKRLRKVHRPHDVHEHHRDLLPLALDIRPDALNLLGQVLGGIGTGIRLGYRPQRGVAPRRLVRRRIRVAERIPTLTAELLLARIHSGAPRTGHRSGQRGPTLAAEASPLEILMTAARAIHNHSGLRPDRCRRRRPRGEWCQTRGCGSARGPRTALRRGAPPSTAACALPR